MISRLNVIVWALNPKYDNLESLVTYLRHFFGEYLENFGIQFKNRSTGYDPGTLHYPGYPEKYLLCHPGGDP
jgi:hypothetical protein